MKKILVSLLSLFIFIGGCATTNSEGYSIGKEFTVNISHLDQLLVIYTPRPGDPVFTMPCRIEFWGSGEIEFRTGRSPQVWDSFSTDTQNPAWNEVYADRRHIGQEGMQELYQAFVDAGLFPKYMNSAAQTVKGGGATIRVAASIGREKVKRQTDDPRLMRLVERQLRKFEDTAKAANTK